MLVLITGTSQGIGKAIAEKFLKEDNNVMGIDRCEATISHPKYKHYLYDVRTMIICLTLIMLMF